MSTRALRSAASGMYAQQINIEVISNNIANINTNGYKKNRAEFKDLLYQDVNVNPQNAGANGMVANVEATVQVGSGVRPASTQKIFEQGDLQNTQNKFDVAIYGEGFFQVRKADGTFAYTRDGALKISSKGEIITSNGYVIEPGLKIDNDVLDMTIAKDGSVSVKQLDGTDNSLGDMELFKFVNPAGLKSLGDNLYAATESSGVALPGKPGEGGFGEIHQFFLESSNVDIVEEMMAMITSQRSYELNSKTVKTVEEMLSITNNLKR